MTDHFQTLGLDRRFAIDPAALERAYIAAQQKFHPDRLVGKPAAERQKAILQSMQANEAFETLKSPLKRARHLLALQGIEVGGERDSVKPEPATLMEIMELREALAEATAKDAVLGMENNASQVIEGILISIERAFNESELQRAAQLAIRLGYLLKLQDEIRIRKKNIA